MLRSNPSYSKHISKNNGVAAAANAAMLSTVVTNINESSDDAQPSTNPMVIPSVTDLTKRFPQQFIPMISGKPNYSSIKEIHNLLMENAASVATTLGGGNHGHLTLVMNPTRYLALFGGAPFILPRNPGPVPVPPTLFMMAVQMELLRQ
eukprot:10263230-Ditylum_brightwellii.AAC.1